MLEYKSKLEEKEADERDAASPGVYAAHNHPRNYLPGEELAAAVNVAITLNRPLLLTGAPGSGKSSVASSVAWQLKMGMPLEFVVKSDTQASDLFYTFDAIGRFAAQKDARDAIRFIDYQALGKAILYTNDILQEDYGELLSKTHRQRAQHPEGDRWQAPRRSVVLIDEIDKAQRDVPNDILVEIERREFSVRELGYRRVSCADGLEPIVIITSNSERALPDAFLRRCIYYHVAFPETGVLQSIVARRLPDRFTTSDHPVVRQATAFFEELRRANLSKPPGTAELLDWLSALYRAGSAVDDDGIDFSSPEVVRTASVCLLKTNIDQQGMSSFIERWRSSRGPAAEPR